ncbi:hypothetical protein [Neorhodopirellula pilleata]|uniref:Uncharacterized protein n=1 Tax=Neorhodopirellula pilleata TaxID=2714738 RepID=A0A5C6B143_9BACT|nr:hypothetical protein [Neorhodopirellula pilleata]TWU04124.1 hypothetical protein Pla100_10610 [Neorhodopirellula pilleata]
MKTVLHLFISFCFLSTDIAAQVALISHAVYGFDPIKQKYTATWYTNFNAIPFQGEADIEPEQDCLNFRMSHPLIAEGEAASHPHTAHFYRITFVDATRLKIQLIETVVGRDEKQLQGIVSLVTQATRCARPVPSRWFLPSRPRNQYSGIAQRRLPVASTLPGDSNDHCV